MKYLYHSYIILFSLLPISFIIGNGPWNINFFLLSSLGLLFLIKNFRSINDLIGQYKYFVIFLGIFSFYIIFYSFFSEYRNESFSRSLPFLKYFFVFIGLLIVNDKIIFKKKEIIFFIIILFLSIFIVLTSSFAELLRLDVPIYTKASVDYRLAGPFGDEEIVGIYLFSFLPSLIFIFDKIKLNIFLKYPILFIIFFIILASGERMAIIMTIALFYFYFFFKSKKIIISISIIGILLLTSFFVFSESLLNPKNKNDYLFRIQQTLNEISNPLNTSYVIHYRTALEIFRENPILGKGVKSFRYECGKDIYNKINKNKNARCRTHPHNLHLEILSETGLLGYILFILFLYYYIKNNSNHISLNQNLILYLALFIAIFPLRVSGSLFSSIYGGLFWYQFFVLYLLGSKKIIK